MKHIGVVILGFALAACAGVAATPSTKPSAPLSIQLTLAPEGQTPAVPAAGATGQGGNSTSVAFQVRIVSPEDNSTLNSPQVEVKGYTVPDAVVTVNDIITIADASGAFTAKVPLIEGPNVLEVLASDDQGNEGYLQLTVTYDPQS